MPSRRAVLHGGLATAIALLAGCTSDDTASPPDGPAESPTPTPSPRPSSPGARTGESGATSTPTEIGRTTPREPVGTGRNPADVVLSNDDGRPHEIRATARLQGAADPHYDQSVTVDPGGRYRMDPIPDDASGTHVFRFRLVERATQERYEWDLSEQSEDGWLSVGVTEEPTFVVQYGIA